MTSEELDEETSAMYRSASMTLAYLSQDRPDLLVLGKELAKGLKRPTQAHFQMLKRGVRLSSLASENDTSVSEPEAIYFTGAQFYS